MLEKISLRTWILMIVGLLLTIVLGDCAAVMWLSRGMTGVASSIVEGNLAGIEACRRMEDSLALQGDLLANILLKGDDGLADGLHQARRDFDGGLKNARGSARDGDRHEVLNEIEARTVRYRYSQDRALELLASGDREAAIRLYGEGSKGILEIRGLCERYAAMHARTIADAGAAAAFRGRTAGLLVGGMFCLALFLGAMLVHAIVIRILKPIRVLAAGVNPGAGNASLLNEVKALARGVSSLMEDVDEKRTQLEHSRERLLQSEKLAMVGKLAASVAHTIRNPLTSVKMRLFSLERSLDLTTAEKEDFEVISEEIRHIDTIVQNFLEFSRPPKLKMQSVSPSDVVDMAIQLLRRRIESYGVTLELFRQRRLSKVNADPEQLKEVLVNLIINACEAMGEGGAIEIREEEGKTEPMGHVAVIRVIDSGPGIPESIKEKVFQPFFSTKDEGTGLGLSIAARIIEDHRGCLNLRSREGKGTTFTITIPCMEEGAWLRS